MKEFIEKLTFSLIIEGNLVLTFLIIWEVNIYLVNFMNYIVISDIFGYYLKNFNFVNQNIVKAVKSYDV